MNFDLQGEDRQHAYRLLTSLVVPRPIAWVTSCSPDGVLNAAPFSFFNVMGSDPPIVALGIGDRAPGQPKDSAANILATGQFVVNLVSRELAGTMNLSAVDFPPDWSEVRVLGLETAPSLSVAVPRLAVVPAALECRLEQEVTIGNNRILIGRVSAAFVRDDCLDTETGYVLGAALDLVGRTGGRGGYSSTRDAFEIPRISLQEWRALQAHSVHTESEADS